ncbi:MAG: putative porin [Candidatus Margulisbacteria bacterium]|jgi:hypothetical protein|nr:putative porin [Candidatus Margulisiibacteriota bacterium]
MENNVRKILVVGALVLCSAAFAAPGWFVNTDVNQDFRYRLHDYAQEDAPNNAHRYRERLRYRIALKTKVNDEFTAGARLLTGDGTNRSTTQTLDNEFEKKQFNLDQAYLSYAPKWVPSALGSFKATVGKFDVKEGIYTVSSIMWDSNISLEGELLNYTYKNLGVEGLDVFANIGSYVLEGDVNPGAPVNLEARQLGWKWKFLKNYNFDAAYAQYTVPAFNTSATAANLNVDASDDKALTHIGAVLGAKLTAPYFEKVALLYEDYSNPNIETKDNHGTAAGIEFGTASVAKLGDYSLRYLTRKVEENIGWNYLEDAHKIAGTEGSQIVLTLGLAENVSFTYDQYDLKYIDKDNGKPWKDTRFEINVKF